MYKSRMIMAPSSQINEVDMIGLSLNLEFKKIVTV